MKWLKTCKYDDVDEAVLKWVKMMRDKNFPVSKLHIKEKAVEYAKHLGHKVFQGYRWSGKFKKRQDIKRINNYCRMQQYVQK